jgi:2,3,4,5-tetrahydropyridine-2,6-dicarboxylate N-succinyltransferase
MMLQETIERMYTSTPDASLRDEVVQIIEELKLALNRGEVRAAEKRDGVWKVNAWVKKGILLAFRIGDLTELECDEIFQFFDKDTMGVRQLSVNNGIRIVPGGTAVRDGAYVAKGVVMMPPSYINIGAYVDEGTMIDSHALVGSCAQIGKQVHISAAAQIGGVLEPVGSMPVIIEDEVFIGGNSGIYEGTIVQRRSVIASGVTLTRSTPVYDLVHQKIYKASKTESLIIPEGAVVVSGSRQIQQPFATEHKLSIYTPIIIKYRDDKTDASTVLEESLR